MQKETRRNSAAGSAKPNPPRKLTRAEKKQIAEIIRQAKGDGKAHTAQQTIPYIQMYPDGICKVTGRKYSKTVAFEDINYQLAQADDKTAIFENWCDFLNYFDASVSVQLSFINQGTQRGEAEKAVNIPAQEDAFNSIRTEYRNMLKNQLAKGNNGLVKAKYITFAIEADSLGAAKSRLARIETDVLNNFKLLGVSARPMTGYERLKMLHGIFHPEGGQFSFDFSWLAPSGLSTKDFIAPSSFRFGEGRYFRMGRKIGAVSFLEILAPELNDRILSDILDLETGVIVNLHIHSIDQTEAIKTIKRKITDLDKMKIEEQKKAVRSGYDMDIIPSDLATFGSEAKNLLLKGAAVCKAEIVRGIARALKMPGPDLPTATADIDTDVCAKAGQTIKFLNDYDFVVTHFNGSDEAAHRYDYTGKADFITRIDEDFIGPVLKSVKEPLKILICGDHVTSCVTGKHSAGNVPVIAAAVNCDNNAPIIGGYHDIHKFLMGASD